MPEVPKLLADWLSAPFRRPVQVTRVQGIEPGRELVRVGFSGQSLKGVKCKPGQEVEFRVSDTSFRHYTPSSFDAARGEMEVLFYLHDKGPGSRWAEALRVGDEVDVLGPGGRFILKDGSQHVLVGDETTLGLFEHFQSRCESDFCGAVELQEDRLSWPQSLALECISPVARTAVRGEALVTWVVEHFRSGGHRSANYYLAGHAQSIVAIRKALVDAGCKKKNVHCKAYWADGKRGL